MGSDSYIIISPVRNESRHLPRTIDSVVAQTVKPRKWIIVNDGSTDNTAHLIDEAVSKHSWIEAIHREDRGYRKSGGGVIEAFYDGYRSLRGEHWSFLVKLDGDLCFDASYFERCIEHFNSEARLGIGGGTIYAARGERWVEESGGDPQFHVRGATKIYRRECWEDIGGLVKAPGWDSLDEIKANMLGWGTRTFPELVVQHYRISGGEDGCWRNWVKNGLANYVAGYHPVFMFMKCVKRAFAGPSLIVPAGLGWGFISGYVHKTPRTEPEVIRYVRREQIKRLLLQPSLWG